MLRHIIFAGLSACFLGLTFGFSQLARIFAKAAAPYENPKLASIEFKGYQDKPVHHSMEIVFVSAGGEK